MWLMLQPEEPEDFVLAVGETHPVREYVEVVKHLGYDIKSASAGHRHDIDNQRRWTGSRTAEEGYDEKLGQVLIKVDERYFRPAEVEYVRSYFVSWTRRR